jgi:microcystin-dependent protein
MTVRNTDTNGWLVCDGRALDRGVYSALFSVLGTSFGSGNGTTTFNIPNANGRVLGTVGSGHALGAKVGNENVTITTGNLPEHTHSGTTNVGGTHTHGITDPGHKHTQRTINDDFNNSGENPPAFTTDSTGERVWDNIDPSTTGITVNAAGEHTHYFTTDGGTGLNGAPLNVMQPTLFIGYTLIYAGV